ncbi:unnamed protein product [Cuscuta campestris]|uniref:Uncharacterized protein n=1 Tax=Cuscuta campestris TaxID=132261 RepID=A0A484NJ58_9ASTE|nr:unnamed protein product [Cuscuta campestris]
METSKEQVGSSSSLTEDLSASKDSSQPSSFPEIFSLLFPPPPAVGKKTPSLDLIESLVKQIYESQCQTWKKKISDGVANRGEWGTIFQDRPDASPLSSSLYYGAQEDMYIKSTGAQSYSKYDKEYDPNEKSSQSVPGANWWDGSVYY